MKIIREIALFVKYLFFLQVDNCVSPKAAAEELGYTFLPCVLSYLHRAPNLIVLNTREGKVISDTENSRINNEGVTDLRNVIIADNVDAVVVPVRISSRKISFDCWLSHNIEKYSSMSIKS